MRYFGLLVVLFVGSGSTLFPLPAHAARQSAGAQVIVTIPYRAPEPTEITAAHVNQEHTLAQPLRVQRQIETSVSYHEGRMVILYTKIE